MSSLHLEHLVDRDHDEAAALFAGPVPGWMPVVVGPDEDTWRVQTREGITTVELVAEVGDVWVLPDGAHHRRVALRPDASAPRDLVTAGLTPAIEGELRLAPTADGRALLAFDGRTHARSAVTGAIERHVVGDPLGRSGVETLLETIAARLATGGAPPTS